MKTSNKFAALAMTCAVLLATSCASSSHDSSTGEKFDDTVITTKVKAAIFNDADLKSAEITVVTYKGVVQLSGFVTDPKEIAEAAKVSRAVKGVVSVKNDLIKR